MQHRSNPLKILLGVTGGVSAYKAAELTRLFQKSGAEVQVVMTPSAHAFISPLTFQALSGRKVFSKIFQTEFPDGMDHIRLAQWADVFVIAPASAGFIAKMAHGMATNLLSTLILAFKGPVFLAPAMNVQMFNHPAVTENLGILSARGVSILGPESGEMACGDFGPGRLMEPSDICKNVLGAISHASEMKKKWAGKTVVVSAGPTQEPFDSVRFMSNPSSGKMGYALAKAANAMGAKTILISGPTALTPPLGVETVFVKTALDMRDAMVKHAAIADLVVMAAAVCDFRFKHHFSDHKVKKEKIPEHLSIERNPDILKILVEMRNQSKKLQQLIVGFSMETESLQENSEAKKLAKGCDVMVANRLLASEGREGVFGSDFNEVTVLPPRASAYSLGPMTKALLAERLMADFAQFYLEKGVEGLQAARVNKPDLTSKQFVAPEIG